MGVLHVALVQLLVLGARAQQSLRGRSLHEAEPNIWCSGPDRVFCTSDPEAHGDGIMWAATCNGYCFHSDCRDRWQECVDGVEAASEAPLCKDAQATNCVVPARKQPVSDAAARRALDDLIEYLSDEPDLQHAVDANRQELLASIKRGEEPDPSKLNDTGAVPTMLELNATEGGRSLSRASDCTTGIALVAVDAVMVGSSLVRLGRVINKRRMTGVMDAMVDRDPHWRHSFVSQKNPIHAALDDLAAPVQTVGWRAKASAVGKIFMDICHAFSIRAIVKAIKQSVAHAGWWFWVSATLHLLIQFAAWVATGMLAFVVEAASIIPTVGDLIVDAVSLSRVAGKC